MRRIALFAVLALSACGMFSDPKADFRYAGPQALPTMGSQEPASAAELETLIVGNTLVGVSSDGSRWARYLRPGGTYKAYVFPRTPPATGPQWTFTRGVWTAADGQLCFRPEEERQETCTRVVAAPGALHGYTDQNGAWQMSADVRPGNPFDL